MRPSSCLLIAAVFAEAGSAAKTSGCPPFPSSVVEFSSGFKQPAPPLVNSEFNTSFVQHKWNQDLSHITAGYIVNSASNGYVRAVEAFEGGLLASSVFNYANVTKEGLVDNTLTTYNPDSKKPDVWRGYVNSNFPIFAKDVLVSNGAVFAGLVDRTFVGRVAAWDIMYQGVIPVTVFVDNCNVVVGYDYFSPGLRTRVITEFFNTLV
ncbi:hypothetical protein BGZ63DRAFT_432809 [Mariannaea sp. PMI_226]|nr:hypothetical protein BGZ63DRAFT_432809 [Mariannaea sp. PMI_226]